MDIKGLEVVCAAQLSGDKVLCQEILDGIDIHETNRDTFGLGEGKPGRLVAKIFKFRLIYGGSAYSYANDPDFMGVSTSQAFWQGVIDAYYKKYQGIGAWHRTLIAEAQRTGRIVIPSGRYFPIAPDYSKREPWPLTVIKNYPVQGFGADLVMLARLRCAQLVREHQRQGKLGEALLVSTVHDSLACDCPREMVNIMVKILNTAVTDVPALVKRIWNYDFTLPLNCEIVVGHNLADMKTHASH